MSRVLALCLALLFPLSASAASKRARKPVVVPKTSAADKQAFEQTFDFIFLQAGQSFLKDEAMPDPAALDPFLAPLLEPELGKSRAKRQRLEELISNSECVQQGPGSISSDVYKLMVDQAAGDLAVGEIVEQNFLPNGRAGRSLSAPEKVLVAACQGQARNQAYDRRAVYQRCLGQKRSEEVYLAPARLGPSSAPQAPNRACVPLLAAVAADRSRFAPKLSEDVGKKLQQTQASLSAGLLMPGEPGVSAFSLPFPTGGTFRKTTFSGTRAGKDDFTQSSDLRTSVPPLNTADLGAGTKLARVSKADEIGFTGYCYSYVKSALQKVGIVDRDTIGAAGAGAHAKQFAAFVEKTPALLKRKLLRVPAPTWPLPIGTIVVWSAGACGFSAVSGHIEIVTRIKPPQACSDGCATFQVACLEELGADPALAAAELPQAQEELGKAQAGYDAIKDDKRAAAAGPRRAAAGVLAKKKAALAAVQARLEPRVAAYVIERPAPKNLSTGP